MNKYLKWILYGSIFFSFYIILVPTAGRLPDVLFHCVPGVVALVIAIYLRRYKFALIAIVSLFLNLGMVYIYPKYVTPVVKRRSALERAKTEYVRFDERKLDTISDAIISYQKKYGYLPSEVNFQNLLLNDELVPNEKTFYSDDTNILIRYFHQGNNFVLVSPGKNKEYDTPEGFENIKRFTGKSDDYILFYPYKAGPTRMPMPE